MTAQTPPRDPLHDVLAPWPTVNAPEIAQFSDIAALARSLQDVPIRTLKTTVVTAYRGLQTALGRDLTDREAAHAPSVAIFEFLAQVRRAVTPLVGAGHTELAAALLELPATAITDGTTMGTLMAHAWQRGLPLKQAVAAIPLPPHGASVDAFWADVQTAFVTAGVPEDVFTRALGDVNGERQGRSYLSMADRLAARGRTQDTLEHGGVPRLSGAPRPGGSPEERAQAILGLPPRAQTMADLDDSELATLDTDLTALTRVIGVVSPSARALRDAGPGDVIPVTPVPDAEDAWLLRDAQGAFAVLFGLTHDGLPHVYTTDWRRIEALQRRVLDARHVPWMGV